MGFSAFPLLLPLAIEEGSIGHYLFSKAIGVDPMLRKALRLGCHRVVEVGVHSFNWLTELELEAVVSPVRISGLELATLDVFVLLGRRAAVHTGKVGLSIRMKPHFN